ncbi:AfsR/SARP family transcriptional regulator [Enterocloster bolteae]|uniref:AfsR/SARP family transcriptional regulator n=1 Tax=Enterocloster bolteae TaxID=208479 RepID=UPI0021095F5B|nr:winged helix-turn-helix domain-containing protein [Enterocloster bolteae]MCQ5140764.1 winged helix-turn-helix domain-containing protein [Enterocloster bolteae]
MPETCKVFIQTFNGFDVFIDDKMIYFPSKKSKELLAILIDKKGGSVSLRQIVDILYNDRTDNIAKKNVRVIYYRLRKILEEYGCQDMLIHKRGVYSIKTDWFECDLYEFMKGNKKYLSAYTGKYMSEYPWASGTVPYLDVIYTNGYDKFRRADYDEVLTT